MHILEIVNLKCYPVVQACQELSGHCVYILGTGSFEIWYLKQQKQKPLGLPKNIIFHSLFLGTPHGDFFWFKFDEIFVQKLQDNVVL